MYIRSWVTLAEVLKKSGYITAHFGKWHLGPMQEIETINGFDYSYSADGEEFKNLKGKTNHFFAEQNQEGKWRFNMFRDRLSRFAQPYSEDYIEKYLQPYANGNNPETLKGTPKRIKEALADCQQTSGKVGWVQNIGVDPQPDSAYSWQNFGTGAFILVGSENY